MKRPGHLPDILLLVRTGALIACVGLIVLAVILNWLPWEPSSFFARRVFRQLGYGALVMLLVAYAYWPRRWFLDRPWLNLARWLKWHIAASYAALGLALVHSWGRTGSSLTFWMMVLFWTVIGSGVAGFFGQRACYRLLSLIVVREIGPERLFEERQRLLEASAGAFAAERSASGNSHQQFLADVRAYLESAWKPWSWLFTRAAYEPVSANLYDQARVLAAKTDRDGIDELWSRVRRRRELDIEYWFHRAARCWLFLHRATAAVLFFLVVAHVASSIRFGGW